jgi:ParB family chromosome partitioning protein
MKKARLGRGLDALLSDTRGDDERPAVALKELPVELLRRGRYQPRTRMDQAALEELAASIKAQGVVQPIVVRGIDDGEYEIIAGERRWRAAQLAGLTTIPAVVRDVPDRAALAVSLIENIQREDLNPVEEAIGLQRLLDEFGLTHQQVADSIGRSRTAVTNMLRLLTLHEKVRAQLESGSLDMGHARALLSLPAERQPEAADTVVRKQLSVRETEHLVRRMARGDRVARSPASSASADVQRLEQDLSERVGASVRIAHRKDGSGQVSIRYTSLDELDGILEHIK